MKTLKRRMAKMTEMNFVDSKDLREQNINRLEDTYEY